MKVEFMDLTRRQFTKRSGAAAAFIVFAPLSACGSDDSGGGNPDEVTLMFGGITHTARGVSLDVDAGELRATFGGPDDTLCVDLGTTLGAIPSMLYDLDSMSVGASILTQTFGRLRGESGQKAGQMRATRVEEGLEILPDFELGDSYTLMLFSGEELIHEVPGHQGSAGVVVGSGQLAAKNCCRGIFYSFTFGVAQELVLPDGTSFTVDAAVFRNEAPSEDLTAIERLEFTTDDIESIVLAGHELAVFHPFLEHSAVGETELVATDAGLTLQGQGRVGVRIDSGDDVRSAVEHDITFAPTDAGEGLLGLVVSGKDGSSVAALDIAVSEGGSELFVGGDTRVVEGAWPTGIRVAVADGTATIDITWDGGQTERLEVDSAATDFRFIELIADIDALTITSEIAKAVS